MVFSFFVGPRYKRRALGVLWIEAMSESVPSSWFAALYEAKAAQLVLYGRALGLSHSEAEDVLQEVFVALVGLREAPRSPEHYCVRAFRNRAMNWRRGFWRRLAREWESSWWFERSADEHPAEPFAMRCLASLPREQREAIVLKFWHGHTFEEIGEITGVSPHTAAGRYRYGLNRIRACLKGTQHEGFERFGDDVAILDSPESLQQDA